MFALFGFAISDRSCPTFPENKDNDLTARRGNVKIWIDTVELLFLVKIGISQLIMLNDLPNVHLRAHV